MNKVNGRCVLVVGLFPLLSVACHQADTTVSGDEVTQVQSALSTDAAVATGDGGTLTPGEEDAFITQAWTQLGGAAVVGNATASSANLPNGVGRYQTFANGVIVWSNTNGAVLVPTNIFNYWVGLVSQPAAEDPTRTQFDYLGLPRAASTTVAANDTVAWDARTTFDGGIIGVKSGQIFSVQGNIYARYAANANKWGFPTGTPAHTNNAIYQATWIGEAFNGGEIWTSGSPAAGYTTFELETGPVFNYWLTSNIGFLDPTSSIQSDGVGGEFGAFIGGNIYSSPPGTSPGGTFGVPSTASDSNGNTLLTAYMALGGTKSWLGYPSAPSGVSPGGAVYSQFQNGLLVMYPSSVGFFSPQTFGQLTFSYDFAQDTDPSGCFGVSIDGFCIGVSEGPFLQTQVTVFPTGSSTPIAGPATFPGPNNGCDQTFLFVFTLSSEAGVFCDGSQQAINYHVPLGTAQGATGITVDLVSQGYTASLFDGSSDPTTGHLEQVYNIDNHFGTNGTTGAVVAPDNSSYNFTTHVMNTVPFDQTDFKGELWWSFSNFDTATLPYEDYIDTYVGVANNGFEGPADWSDELYYSLIYENSAADGNCFGMALDSIDAAFSNRSAYNEPIHQYFQDPISTQGGQPLCPDVADVANNGCTAATVNTQYAALGQELNVKFGYQLGEDMINYYLEGFTIGGFEAPSTALDKVTAALQNNEYPVFGITSSLSFGNGHAIRPYRVGPSGQPCQNISGNNATCTQVFVLDPNIPTGRNTQEQFVEFSNDDRWAYIPTNPDGSKFYTAWEYSGGLLSDGIIVTTPYSVIDHRPYAPTTEIEVALAAVGLYILSSGTTLSQVTDDSGRTLFTAPLTGPPAGWQSLATGASKIPNIFPIPLPTDPAPNAATIWAQKGISTKQMFDVGVSPGKPAGSTYEASFMSKQLSVDIQAPGAPGTFDRVTMNRPGMPDRSATFSIPANGSAKTVGSWSIMGADRKRPIVLSQMAVKPAQQITAALQNGGGRIRFANNGPATSATISIGKPGTLPVAVGTIQIPSGESGQDCSFTGATPTCTAAPTELNDIFGFESPTAWTGQGFPLKTVSSPKTQGSFALDVGGTNYREVFSQSFSTAILQGVTSKMALDIFIPTGPTNPSWLGLVQLYANCPSAGIYHAYQDQVLLTGDPLGAFTTGKFNLQPAVVAAMKASHSDFSLSIAVNASAFATDPILDNLRFTN